MPPVTIDRLARVGLGVAAVIMFVQSMMAFNAEERYYGWLGLLICVGIVVLLAVDWHYRFDDSEVED
jgi:hypothetical protein